MAGGVPDATADVARGDVSAVPLERGADADLAGRNREAALEDRTRVPDRPGDADELVGVLRVEVCAEEAVLNQRAVRQHPVDDLRDVDGVLIRGVGVEHVSLGRLEHRRLGSAVVDVRHERVAHAAEDVAGVLGGELVAEFAVLLPRGRDVVAELIEQRLVVIEDGLRKVVAKPVLRAVDGRDAVRARDEAVEEVLVEEALVQGCRETLLAVRRVLRCPDRVILLSREDDVRPAVAGLVHEGDLALERPRASGVAVVGLELDRDVGVGLLESRDGRLARGIHPHGDGAVLHLFGGREAVLAVGCAVTAPVAAGAGAECQEADGGGCHHRECPYGGAESGRLL